MKLSKLQVEAQARKIRHEAQEELNKELDQYKQDAEVITNASKDWNHWTLISGIGHDGQILKYDDFLTLHAQHLQNSGRKIKSQRAIEDEIILASMQIKNLRDMVAISPWE